MHRIENNLLLKKQKKMKVKIFINLHVHFHRVDYLLISIYQMKPHFSSNSIRFEENQDEHENDLDNVDQLYQQQPNLN